MTALQRIKSDRWIRKNALSFGIGYSNVSLINKIGIKKATERAMRMALMECKQKIDHLLIDAFYLPNTKGIARNNQTAIIKGDQLSFSIAAASIIAKVYRDSIMDKIGSQTRFQKYKWSKNKGYGTLSHREAILKYGLSIHHRTQFINTFLKNQKVLFKSL